MQISFWLALSFYAILCGYYLGLVCREWKDYNIVSRIWTIIIITCCAYNILRWTHLI